MEHKLLWYTKHPFTGAIFFILTVLFATSSYFVWLPDVVFYRTVMLNRACSNDGREFSLCQKWNYGDFYDTFLQDKYMDETFILLLDSDDKKIWLTPIIEVDESMKELRVLWKKRLIATYNWKDHEGEVYGSHQTYNRKAIRRKN